MNNTIFVMIIIFMIMLLCLMESQYSLSLIYIFNIYNCKVLSYKNSFQKIFKFFHPKILDD